MNKLMLKVIEATQIILRYKFDIYFKFHHIRSIGYKVIAKRRYDYANICRRFNINFNIISQFGYLKLKYSYTTKKSPPYTFTPSLHTD